MTGLTVQGLTFKNTGLNKTILALFLSNNILLTDLFFQGNKLGVRATVPNCSTAVLKNNCTFRDHRGLQYGSAVSILNGSKAYISNCVFVEITLKYLEEH